MQLIQAQKLASQVVLALRPYCEMIEVGGSIRRCKPECGDIEIVCIPKTVAKHDMFETEIGRQRHPGFKQTVNRWKFVKGDAQEGKYMQRIMVADVGGQEGVKMKIDIFTANKDNWGYILAIRTGSDVFSKQLAAAWNKAGYHGDDGYLCDDNGMVPVPTEEHLFKLIGMDYVEPHNRNK